MEILILLLTNPVSAFLLFIGTGYLLQFILDMRRAKLAHLNYVAELEHKKDMAIYGPRILPTPRTTKFEDPKRKELANELLEAYDDIGKELQNDEKSNLQRWD